MTPHEQHTVLEEAKSIIYGDREATYGAPDKNLNTIADLWQSYCVARGLVMHSERFNAYDVCMMMVLMKVARQASTHKLDNLVDICGYTALVERVKNHLDGPKQLATGSGGSGATLGGGFAIPMESDLKRSDYRR